MDLTKNISVHETFFSELHGRYWWEFNVLPMINLTTDHILIAWLCFSIDIHKKGYPGSYI